MICYECPIALNYCVSFSLFTTDFDNTSDVPIIKGRNVKIKMEERIRIIFTNDESVLYLFFFYL